MRRIGCSFLYTKSIGMHMKWALIGLLLLGMALSAMAQTPTPTLSTSKAAAYDRMLDQFNNPETIDGILIVSFASEVLIDEAELILQKYQLTIWNHQNCITTSIADPGQPTQNSNDCWYVTEWNDSLKTARVQVPAGQERRLAQELYAEEKIEYVEPEVQFTIQESDVEPPFSVTEPPGSVVPTPAPIAPPATSTTASPYLLYGLALLILLGLITVWKKGK